MKSGYLDGSTTSMEVLYICAPKLKLKNIYVLVIESLDTRASKSSCSEERKRFMLLS